MRCALIIPLLLIVVGPAAAQDFTWSGWFGPEYSDPAWGSNWTWDNQLMENGWGHQWWYFEDPEPHFPNLGSSVLIPGGAVVDTYGGDTCYCGALTVAPDAVLQVVYGNLFIAGPTLQNDGRIDLIAGGGSVSGFLMTAPLSISGTGEIFLAPGRFHSEQASIALTVGPGQVIHGDGHLGSQPYGNYHGIELTNHGVIRATSTVSPLDVYGLDVRNDGTVEAAAGAMLRLWGDWDNTGGELLASDGGVVLLGGGTSHPARIEGGTLRTVGGGEVWPDAHGSLENLTIDGILHIRRYASVHMADTITNLGLIDQGTDGSAGIAVVYVDSALTFAGDGRLRMGDANVIQMPTSPDAHALVTNGPEHTIESHGGQFGTLPNDDGDQRIALLNQGTLVCEDAAYATLFNVTGEGFENQGTLILEPAPAVNATVNGDFRQTAGLLDCDDGLVITEGTAAFSGGVLAGHGYLQGTVTLGGEAVIHPGGVGEVGTFDIHGPLTLTAGATLVCEWAHDQKDRLVVHGLLSTLGAVNLRIEYVELDPPKGADYVVMTCDDLDDQAAWALELPAGWTSDGLEWEDHQLVVRNLAGAPTPVPDAPSPLALHGAAPNPFNPRTTLRFSLDQERPMRLWISDLAGRRVRGLIDGVRPAGEHAEIWDGCDEAGRAVGSGTYLGVLEAAGERRARRLTLVR